MSELIVIGYEDHAVAAQAYGAVLGLPDDVVIARQGLALVTVDDEGKTHVETPSNPVEASAAGGAVWGAIIGLLFFMPFFGGAIGGAIGALMGKVRKSGVHDEFRAQVRDLLRPGKAAVVVMASKIVEEPFGAALKPFAGTILKTSMPAEDERELVADFAPDARSAPATHEETS